MTFLPIPAIDVLDGRVVRLHQGDYDQVTAYADDPIPLLQQYVEAGASRVHLVHLDGARTGSIDSDLVRAAGSVVPDLQVGGGVRSVAAAVELAEAGAARIVVGSIAVHDPATLEEMVGAVGALRIVVAADVRDGRARGAGWLDDGEGYEHVVRRAVGLGIGSLLVTGIDRDGTMDGPDLELVRAVRRLAPEAEIIASGGVAELDDLTRAGEAGADAAVIGKALLDGRFTVEEALGRFREG